MNELTTTDIKNSIDYRWRIHNAKVYLLLWGIISGIVTIALFIISAIDFSKDVFLINVCIWLGFVVVYGAVFGSFALYQFMQAKKLLKNFNNFKIYQAVLDSPSISYFYGRSVYYTVMLGTVTADTHPCFSNSVFSKFELSEYNNKTVRCLYDAENWQVYLIDIVQ